MADDKSETIAERFLRETPHLGPDGQRRVLDAIRAANASRKLRLAKAAADVLYPIEPETINRGEPPAPGKGTYSPPPPYNVQGKPDPAEGNG